MSRPCLLCYITDRSQFPGDESSRCRQLLNRIAEAVRCGIDYIQLREKDLSTRDLEQLAAAAVNLVRQQVAGAPHLRLAARTPRIETRLLINSRTDIALAAGADGVHLRSNDAPPHIARQAASLARSRNPKVESRGFTIGVSCHTAAEVAQAAAEGADFAVYAPVYEKRDFPQTHPTGIEALRQACLNDIPVLALGGVTLDNAPACLKAGATGIAAIRLFQENDIREVVETLRAL
jgi:thiamine-phosphate pyrophosphorylase